MTDEERKKASNRIDGLRGYTDIKDILNTDPTIIWFLTDYFRDEQLVRKIVAKESTKEWQLIIYKNLEESAIKMYRELSPVEQQEIGKIGLNEKIPPYFFRQIKTDILTRQPIVSEENDVVPAAPRGIKSADDIFRKPNSNIKGQESKDNQPKEDNCLKEEGYKTRITELEEELERIQAENAELREELDAMQSPAGAPIDTEGHGAVRLELLRRLMDKDGAEWEKHGNKVIAARLMEAVTGLALKTCRNHLSDPIVNQTEHQQEILDTNSKLQALGMSIRL